MTSSGADSTLARVGRFSARHGWWVVAAWIVLLIAATLGHRITGGEYSDNFQLANSSAQQGADLLKAHEPSAGGQTGQLVFTVDDGTLNSHSSQLTAATQNVAKLPHVLSVSNPLAAETTSKDRTAYATVNFDVNPSTLSSSYLDSVDDAVAGARADGVNVDYGGVLGQAARPKANDVLSEVIGIAVAIVVLLIGFGSVYAAGLPILTALTGVGTGLGILGIAASTTNFASVAPTLGLMIGLGVGIDYALFLTTRHRQLVMDGLDPAEAAARTVSSSGRAVMAAAVTVIIAMLGLFASGIGFIGKLGSAAAITVAVAALAALTLVPALLGLAGRHIDRLRVRYPVAESGIEGGDTGWHRYAERISRHPWRYLAASVTVLVALAIPVLSMTLGHVDAGADPTSYTDRRAYDAISNAFGPGANGPLTVVVELSEQSSSSALTSNLDHSLTNTPGVASVSPPTATPDGALLVSTVVPTTGPQDAATDQLYTELTDHTLPDTLAGTGAHGYVTGTLPANLDFRDRVSARLPVIIAVVIGVAFLLLLASFRSPVLALKAAVLNLFSIGAAYGVIVAVFQWGWGGSLLGVDEKVPIESYVPMMMFAIVFGLSMDYEVFLVSRIRERWLATYDNKRSVADGLAVTARVISCAALIMTSVFLAFLLSSNVVIKMMALGLGLSVLIDATLIRLVAVPATMFLLGRANWWLPRWLDRLLPHLAAEGKPATTPTGANT